MECLFVDESEEEDVFVLELERGTCGLGLALVDGQVRGLMEDFYSVVAD